MLAIIPIANKTPIPPLIVFCSNSLFFFASIKLTLFVNAFPIPRSRKLSIPAKLAIVIQTPNRSAPRYGMVRLTDKTITNNAIPRLKILAVIVKAASLYLSSERPCSVAVSNGFKVKYFLISRIFIQYSRKPCIHAFSTTNVVWLLLGQPSPFPCTIPARIFLVSIPVSVSPYRGHPIMFLLQ